MVAIPGALGYVAYNTDVCRYQWYKSLVKGLTGQGKYHLRGKRREDSIAEF